MTSRRSMLKAALALPFVAGTIQGKRMATLGAGRGLLARGKDNAITDVNGVTVGHATVIDDALKIRTGVTAILPRGTLASGPCRAGTAVLNGNGEMTGVMAIRRTGMLDVPVLLTGTANVGIVYNAAIELIYPTRGMNVAPAPIVAECWDGLGDIRGRHLTGNHVGQAFSAARSGPVAEGGVGGGTGMTCYGFRGGIGTASRVVAREHGGYTVGVLVNANHGTREQLMVWGVPVGKELKDYPEQPTRPASSIVMVAASDAPLKPRQLDRIAMRMSLGLARTGATANTSSGDLMLAFSTARLDATPISDESVTPLYQAVVEAAEEAILNALAAGVEIMGISGRMCPALPMERVAALLKSRGVL